MSRVRCSVESCSYNQNGGCHVNQINIGGKSAQNEKATCCGTFINKAVYSNLAEYTSMRGEAEIIKCVAESCKYNSTGECSLDEIQVGGESAVYHTQTDCLSFEKQ